MQLLVLNANIKVFEQIKCKFGFNRFEETKRVNYNLSY